MERSQAYMDGFKAGQADRLLGIKRDVSFFSDRSLNEYMREYSRGYRQGVLGLRISRGVYMIEALREDKNEQP